MSFEFSDASPSSLLQRLSPMVDGPIRRKSYDFALEIIRLSHALIRRREYTISRQLVRSGTAIGASVEESVAAQSRRDFVAKMSIASKEARECHYWLRLIRDAPLLPRETVAPHLERCEELIRLLTAIVKTTSRT